MGHPLLRQLHRVRPLSTSVVDVSAHPRRLGGRAQQAAPVPTTPGAHAAGAANPSSAAGSAESDELVMSPAADVLAQEENSPRAACQQPGA